MEEIEDVYEEDEPIQVTFKKPFEAKFIQSLNDLKYNLSCQTETSFVQQHHIPSTLVQTAQSTVKKRGARRSKNGSKKLKEVMYNGNKIVGEWVGDKIHGQATIQYSNGIKFKGRYQNGIKVQGHFIFLNGYEYIGKCLGNKFHGQGKLTFPSGKIIIGEWNEYNIIGQGIIQYPKGECYIGEINNLKKHGNGTLKFSDGNKYVGQFENGAINGEGTYYVNEKPISTGTWCNGQLQKQNKQNNKQSEDGKSSKDSHFVVQCKLNVNDVNSIETKIKQTENRSNVKKTSKPGFAEQSLRSSSIKKLRGVGGQQRKGMTDSVRKKVHFGNF